MTFTQPLITSATREPQPINKPKQVLVSKSVVKPTVTPKAQPTVTDPAPVAMAQQSQAKTTAATPQTPQAENCEEAIEQVWPASLQADARLVALKESSLQADSIGTVNPNGSQDFGCFQINNYAHPDFFADGDWRNPTYNAQYALQIYNSRGNWTAWYAVRGILW